MTNYLNLIAVSGNTKRRNAITNILDNMNVDYNISSGGYSKNIVVSLNPSSERLVIGAHYDEWNDMPHYSGYVGANDNAAACVILLNLIDALKDTDQSIDFVFFDMEERGMRGSQEYLECIGRDNISAMINLDMCGMGTNIVMTSSRMKSEFKHKDLFNKLISDCLNVVDSLPPGDSCSFESEGIPSLFIINSTDHDLRWFKKLSDGCYDRYMVPDFGYTMHQKSDTPDSFSDYGMNMIYEYLVEHLNQKAS